MRRACIIFCLVVVAGSSLVGCRSFRGSRSDEKQAELKDVDKHVTTADESNSDGEKEDEAAVARADKDSSSDDGNKPVSHGADTLALIEKELKDATPQERDALFQDLKGLDPEKVQMILRIGRIRRQQGEKESIAQVAGETSFGPSMGSFDRSRGTDFGTSGASLSGTGYSGSQSSFAATVPQASLGTASPWPQIQRPNSPQAAPAHYGNTSNFQQPRPWGSQAARDQRNNQNGWGSGQALARAPQTGIRPGPTSPWDRRRLGSSGTNTGTPFANRQPGTAVNAFQNSGTPSAGTMPSNGFGGHNAPTMAANGSRGNSIANRSPMAIGQSMQGNMPGPTGFNRPEGIHASAGSLGNPFSRRNPALLMSPQTDLSQFRSGTFPNNSSSNWNHELQRLISLAADEASQRNPSANEQETRAYVEKQVCLRMLHLMAGQPERAFEPVHGINAADQEFWTQLLWGIASYFDSAIPDANDRATQTVAQLRTAIERLQENAKLELRNVAFCNNIESYGDYQRFPRDEFSPGEPVLVYAEVGNFKSEPVSGSKYRTLLSSTIEIFQAGATTNPIEQITFQPAEDLCRNHRRDYFHSYEFAMPQRIGLGPHVMKLTVEDQLSRKIATYTLNFMVK